MKKRRIRSSNKNTKNSVDDIKNKVLKEIRKELMAKKSEHTNEDDNIETSNKADDIDVTPVNETNIKDNIANTPKKRGRKRKEIESSKETESSKENDSLSVEDDIDYSQIKEPKNAKLTRARKAKNDEFYTRLCDVENELAHYTEHFKDKVVLCNCDDPTWSAFWKYFHINFSVLGLKKLIGTHYETEKPNSYAVVYEGGNDANTDAAETIPLVGNGDFRSAECLKYLKECDIVVTNPPFSLFREFISVMEQYSVKYVVIGNPNAVTYCEIFPLIRDNKLWLGHKPWSSEMYFGVTDDYKDWLLEHKEEGSAYVIKDNKLYARNMSIWFTNLDIKKRYEDLILYKTYNETDYPTYDNYDAINVDKVKDIPIDYDGIMGVPITFLDKYNPNQFEIVGLTASNGKEFSSGIWLQESGVAHPLVNGVKKYVRMFIKRKHS